MLLLLIAAAFACEAPVDNAALQAEVDQAIARYEDFEIPRFIEAADRLEGDLACASQALSPTLAARVHLVVGLRRWVGEGEKDRATDAWAAARAIDPSYTPSPLLFPPQSAESLIWNGIDARAGASRALTPGSWWVDGVAAESVSTERPALVQQLDALGAPVRTTYSWPGDAWPPSPAPSRSRAGPLALGAGSLVAAGLGTALLVDAGRMYRSDAFATAYWSGTDDFQAYYDEQFKPRWYGGLALASVGALGLAGSGLWFAVTPGGAAVSGRF